MLGHTMLREMPPAGGRIDPVRQMQRTQADLNRLFSGLRFAAEFPPLNLWTSPDGAILAAEVPGVAPEDLDVTIRRDTVILRGTRPSLPTDDGPVLHRLERTLGPFARTVVLPFRVDVDSASASFERGVLTLTLPRPHDDKPRQIKVARS
jgi:HSP20 family protein